MRQLLRIALMMSFVTAASGCHTVGQVMSKTAQVIADPSIPVGNASDQPTQIALSLYATEDVNPNAKSGAAIDDDEAPSYQPLTGSTTAVSAPPSGESSASPYVVHLQGMSEADLLAQLQGLVAALKKDEDDNVPMVEAAIPRSLSQASSNAPFMPRWPTRFFPGTGTVMPYLALPLTAPFVPSGMATRALGQYDDALSPPPSSTSSRLESVATPITFRVIQLKDDSLFLATSYEPLIQDAKKVLGSAFLAEDTYVLKPGQFKYIGFAPVDKHAHYVAVVASYHDLDGTHWKQSLRIDPTGHRYPLLIRFAASGVSIQDDVR